MEHGPVAGRNSNSHGGVRPEHNEDTTNWVLATLECHSGIRPRGTTDFLVIHGPRLKTSERHVPEMETITKHRKNLRKVLSELHANANRKRMRNREQNWKAQKRLEEPNLHVGDWVLLACIRKKSKLHLNWMGPFELVSTKSDFVMMLKDPHDNPLQDT